MTLRKYKTAQEGFWAGEFGNTYIKRNSSPEIIPWRTALFAKVLQHTQGIQTILEFGSNVGLNLHALHHLLPEAKIQALEINQIAFNQLQVQSWVNVHLGSILEAEFVSQADFVFTCGVLIHINPDYLPTAYDALYKASNRYIFVCEYFNPSPVSVIYRGNKDRLFKRDFVGELLDKYNDLDLLDYGFIYKRDNNFPLDNMNWFLLEKRPR